MSCQHCSCFYTNSPPRVPVFSRDCNDACGRHGLTRPGVCCICDEKNEKLSELPYDDSRRLAIRIDITADNFAAVLRCLEHLVEVMSEELPAEMTETTVYGRGEYWYSTYADWVEADQRVVFGNLTCW